MSKFLDEKLLEDTAGKILELAQKNGADQAEVSLSRSSGQNITTRMTRLETIEHLQNQEAGITVYADDRKAAVNTSDLSDSSLNRLVENAMSFLRYTAADEDFGLADKELLGFNYPEVALFFPIELSVEKQLDLAQNCEEAGLNTRGISNSEGASFTNSLTLNCYANSLGFCGHYKTSSYSLGCSLIAGSGDNMQQNYEYTSTRDFSKLEPPQAIGAKAAEKTLAKLNPSPLKTGTYPVVFHSDISAGLFASFLSAVNGMSLYRGLSFLVDSLGRQIFPAWLNIREKPHLNAAPASAPFDAEGVKTYDRYLVENGVVKSYVLNSFSARKLKMQTTANAGGTHNILLSSNSSGFEDIIAQMNTGVLITEVMGAGVNTLTGDYSRAANGFWVEDGKIRRPVDNFTVAGNLKDMFMDIKTIGNDVDKRKSIQSGSVFISKMTISGA